MAWTTEKKKEEVTSKKCFFQYDDEWDECTTQFAMCICVCAIACIWISPKHCEGCKTYRSDIARLMACFSAYHITCAAQTNTTAFQTCRQSVQHFSSRIRIMLAVLGGRQSARQRGAVMALPSDLGRSSMPRMQKAQQAFCILGASMPDICIFAQLTNEQHSCRGRNSRIDDLCLR